MWVQVKFKKLLGILGLLHVIDFITTLYARNMGLVEGNIIYDNALTTILGFSTTFSIIKIIGIFIIIPIAYKTYPKLTPPEQTIFHWVFTLLTILASIVAINNIVIIILSTTLQ